MFEQNAIAENIFLKNVVSLRDSVSQHLVPTARRDAASAIDLLQTVLTAEIVCVLRYTAISVSDEGLKNSWIGAEFQEQANDERRHMEMAAQRIVQLGGVPDYSCKDLSVIDSESSFAKRVSENLAAEQCVIDHYRDLMTYFAGTDPESCAMIEEIVRDEEDHTSDMQDLLATHGAK